MRNAITDEGLAYLKAAYSNEKITKDDIFFTVMVSCIQKIIALVMSITSLKNCRVSRV